MASPPRPFDVSVELKALRHERQNQDLRRLPPNATIRRRPLNHAPIADVRSSGAKAPKVVYVSRRTPAIAAVKRVKRYLNSIEKRALQNAGAAVTRKGGHGPRGAVEKANEALAKNKEEVLVKASGRAMAQALRVGEWFRTHEKDMLCNVEVRTGSVSTVDDIVEGRGDDENEDEDEHEDKDDGEAAQAEEESLKPQYGDTTLELLGGVDTTMLGSAEQATSTGDSKAEGVAEKGGADTGMDDSLGKQSRRKRKKRKRQMYEADELPEARIRWVNTVEIAISLQA